MRPQAGSVAFDLCIHLVKQERGATMSAAEVRARFGTKPQNLWRALRLPLVGGYLERFKVPGENQYTYTLGPKLRDEA